MGSIIENRLDASNRIMNLQTYILQEIIDSILSEKIDRAWAQQLYSYGKKLKTEDNNKLDSFKRKEREKYADFVESVDKRGGIEFATKDLIDTTLAIQIIMYNRDTKKYFEIGNRFSEYVRSLGSGRNAIKHRLDTIFRNPDDEQISFYYSLCLLQLTELYSFVEYLKKNDSYKPTGKMELIGDFFARIKEIGDEISKELGDAVNADDVKEELVKINECEREYGQNTRLYIKEEITKLYNNPIITGKMLESFEMAVKARIVNINYLYIIEQCVNNNDSERYIVYFSDASLKYFLSEVIGNVDCEEGDGDVENSYFDTLTGKIATIYNRRKRKFVQGTEYVILSLALMMDICDKYSSEIKAIYDEKLRRAALDVFSYSNKQINKLYQNNVSYVDIPWQAGDGDIVLLEDIINDIKCPIRLCGEAGCGKSTAINQLVYRYALGTYNSEYIKLPVLVELYKLSNTNGVFDEMSNILGLDKETIYNFLNYDELILFLDGYDEIYDYEVKKLFSREIDDIRKNYPDLKIVISDRYVNSDIPILIDSKTFFFYPLNNDSIKELVEKKCEKQSAKEYLFSSIVDDPEYFSIYDTPLKVIILIDIVENEESLPTDYIESYIKQLLTREKNEKKNINVEYIEGCLEALALLEDNISSLKAERQIGRFLQCMHYTNADSKEVLRIADGMGIINNRSNSIAFASDDFRNYFEIKGIIDEIEDILR